ncbi:DUF1742-domain-containing protein [Pseudovirgaria hyperparasitica]|uniref:DUF1742-domain-containing protein n=1 Tax=Pseudovirgaria hyperparasitica TaxID=470096 RepID=A0A6A6WCA8_9PEZI|nr:DUF1742-domain-containing protein [Pseudovirgaria hyperparasitica]KAF2759684.1 DUF1742-domain-containing protein [Pseudovirgaria hyperparasitica]
MALKNTWYHRRVADSAAKACWICYKPSTSVLITPDNKDFFYTCAGHLKDRNFAVPDPDEAAAAEKRKKDDDMQKEIDAVKKEYAEKMKKRMEKKEAKKKEKDKSDEKKKEEEQKGEEEESALEKEKNDKIDALSKKETAGDDGPRIYSLHKNFYQQRLDRIRNAELAKRNRERLKDPSTFPAVPSNLP